MNSYQNYKDIRGGAARRVSSALGIDEPSGVRHTGYLVEVREAHDHVRLSAHAATYFREVLIFNDRRLEDIYIDTLAERASKTVYSPDGVITTYQAPWSVGSNGYKGEYTQTERLEGQLQRAAAEWEKFDAVLMDAEIGAGRQPIAPQRGSRPAGPRPSGKTLG